jgi:hypothetical protein
MEKRMKRADYCAVCSKSLDEMSLQLQQQGDRTLFCSLECLVSYAVGRIRQRLEQRNSQVRMFANEQKKLHAGRHSKRGGRSTVA